MVNYVCRTCLYVCDNEFSFRRLEKVKQVLELFVPEIKTFVGKYSLICEQCYYFLKNVEKFKTKCIETQKKLYSMNIETIKDTYDAVLQSVVGEVPFRGQQQIETHSQINLEAQALPRLKRSAVENRPKKVSKRSKQDLNISVTSTATSECELTLTNLLKSVSPLQKQTINKNNNSAILNPPIADDLLQLFNYRDDINDLRAFREFAVKGVSPNKESEEMSSNNCLTESSRQLVINYEDDEYMSRNDLVSAGILSDDSNKSADGEPHDAESESNDDNEIVEVDDRDNSKSDNRRVEINISDSCKESTSANKSKEQTSTNLGEAINDNNETEAVSFPSIAIVKKEIMEDENPGFFNKQSTDGYYKCRLCGKQYKTSKGLYEHTKKLHENEVKIHHCEYCNFFTLWKSSLIKHNSLFHMEIMEKINPTISKCYHCSFSTRSKEQLSRHITDSHVYEKFICCSLCRSRFSDSVSFARHVEKEHLILNTRKTFDFCISCNKSFLSTEDYKKHVENDHRMPLRVNLENSVIKEFCASCSKVFHTKNEYKEHKIKVHAYSS